MVTVRTRLIRLVLMLGLVAALGAVTPIGAGDVLARPVPTDTWGGEPNGNGDPTGDDLPSPTPKPGKVTTASTGTYAVRGFSRDRWSFYLSILIRLGIR